MLRLRVLSRFSATCSSSESLLASLQVCESLPESQSLLAELKNLPNFPRSPHSISNHQIAELTEYLTPSELATLALVQEKTGLLPSKAIAAILDRVVRNAAELDEADLSVAVYAVARSAEFSAEARTGLLSALSPANYVCAKFHDSQFSKKLVSLVSKLEFSGASEILSIANYMAKNQVENYLAWKNLTTSFTAQTETATLHELVSFAYLHAKTLPRNHEADEVFRAAAGRLVSEISNAEIPDMLLFIEACSAKEWRDLPALSAAVKKLRTAGYLAAQLDERRTLRLATQLDRLGCRVPELDQRLGADLTQATGKTEQSPSKTWFTERATTRKIPAISGRRLRQF